MVVNNIICIFVARNYYYPIDMNRKLLTLFLLSAFAIAAWAQDHSQRLVVWQKSGEKVYFDLAEEPKTTFNNGLLVIKTNTMETCYQLSNILRYTYEGYATGVSEVKKRSLTVAQSNDGMTLSNVPAGTVLRLFDAAGRLLDSQTSICSRRSRALRSTTTRRTAR